MPFDSPDPKPCNSFPTLRLPYVALSKLHLTNGDGFVNKAKLEGVFRSYALVVPPDGGDPVPLSPDGVTEFMFKIPDVYALVREREAAGDDLPARALALFTQAIYEAWLRQYQEKQIPAQEREAAQRAAAQALAEYAFPA